MAEAANIAMEERIVMVDRTNLLCMVMIVVGIDRVVVQSDGGAISRKERWDKYIFTALSMEGFKICHFRPNLGNYVWR